MNPILRSAVRRLRLTVVLPVLGACASPQFDCASFPAFSGVSLSSPMTMSAAQGRAILSEAESFRDLDHRAIVRGYISFGAFGDAADFIRRTDDAGSTRAAVLLLIEAAALSGELDFAKELVDEFGSDYLDGAASIALAAGQVRSGDLEAAFALAGIRNGRSDATPHYELSDLQELADWLDRGRHYEAVQLLRSALGPQGAGTPLFSTLRIRGQTYIAGRADLVDPDNVDQIAAQIATIDVPDGIAKYSVLFAVAEVYVALGRDDDAAPILRDLVREFTEDGSGYADEYLTPILRLQLQIGRNDDIGNVLDYVSSRFDQEGQARPRVSRAREMAKELADLLFAHGRSADMYRAMETAATARSRGILRSGITWAEAIEGNRELALQIAAEAEGSEARCWAMADVASAIAMRGDGRSALDLAEGLVDEACIRNAGFAPTSSGIRGPDAGFLTPVFAYDNDLFTTIAVAAAYYGDGETVCTALNSDPIYRPWIDAVGEVSALRTAAGDYDVAIQFIRSAWEIRPSDADDWSEIVARMVTHEPPVWSPPN